MKVPEAHQNFHPGSQLPVLSSKCSTEEPLRRLYFELPCFNICFMVKSLYFIITWVFTVGENVSKIFLKILTISYIRYIFDNAKTIGKASDIYI